MKTQFKLFRLEWRHSICFAQIMFNMFHQPFSFHLLKSFQECFNGIGETTVVSSYLNHAAHNFDFVLGEHLIENTCSLFFRINCVNAKNMFLAKERGRVTEMYSSGTFPNVGPMTFRLWADFWFRNLFALRLRLSLDNKTGYTPLPFWQVCITLNFIEFS